MSGLFYAIVGIHGVPNVWMTVDNGLTWTNAAESLPRTLWFGSVHPLTGTAARLLHGPPYPVAAEGLSERRLQGRALRPARLFYGLSARPPVF